MLSVGATKGLCAALSTLITFGIGVAPWKLRKYVDPDNHKHVLATSFLLCFGAGVLLATSLAHMAPEFIEMCDKGFPDADLPVGLIFMSCGFMFIYFIEESVQYMCFKPKKEPVDRVRLTSLRSSRRGTSTDLVDVFKPGTDAERPFETCQDGSDGTRKYHVNGTQDNSFSPTEPRRTSLMEIHGVVTPIDNSHQHVPSSSSSSIREFLTVLALSFHSVFEGLAIGLEASAPRVWILWAAISVHKSVIAFCVGVEIFTNAQNAIKRNILYMATFALMSPIGICTGIAIMSFFDEENAPVLYNAVVGLCQALAGGTLLYVTVFEIMDREKSREEVNGLVQLLFIVLGYGMILLIEYIVKSNGIDT